MLSLTSNYAVFQQHGTFSYVLNTVLDCNECKQPYLITSVRSISVKSLGTLNSATISSKRQTDFAHYSAVCSLPSNCLSEISICVQCALLSIKRLECPLLKLTHVQSRLLSVSLDKVSFTELMFKIDLNFSNIFRVRVDNGCAHFYRKR